MTQLSPESLQARTPIVMAVVSGILAVMLAGAFAPVLLVVGAVLNPFPPLGIEPSNVYLSDEEHKALELTASEHIWLVIVLSILVLVVVVSLAIVLGGERSVGQVVRQPRRSPRSGRRCFWRRAYSWLSLRPWVGGSRPSTYT